MKNPQRTDRNQHGYVPRCFIPNFNNTGFLRISILMAAAFQLASKGIAQENLANLYDWSNETRYSGSPEHNVQIDSLDSAIFFGSQSTNNAPCPFALPELSATITTTPGSIYEISFTMQNDFVEIGQAIASFGDFATNLNLPAAEEAPSQTHYFPINVDFAWQATSLASEFSFMVPIDDSDAVSLNNFSIIEIPECSTARIFGLFGCIWIVARRR